MTDPSPELSRRRLEDAIADIAVGRMVVVVGGPDRENEGALVFAADQATPQAVNFMAKHGRGLICVALEPERLAQLGIPRMWERGPSRFETPFHVSVDDRELTTTGISSPDRAATIVALASPRSGPDTFVRPGHVFPVAARPGGVLERPGQTEASLELAALAGRAPAAVTCEIMRDDGRMARLPELEAFARGHGLRLVSIEDLVSYRRQQPASSGRAEARVSTRTGPRI